MVLFRARTLTLAAIAVAACQLVVAKDSFEMHKEAKGIAYHYVGRVKLNFLDNTGVVYGYLTALSGVNTVAPLFAGAPSESSAYLTFRSDIKFQALPGNGSLGSNQFAVTPILVEAGAFFIYFTPSPAHNWVDPDTFSNGEPVATLNRAVEQFSVYPAFSIDAGAATLKLTKCFTLPGVRQPIDLREQLGGGAVDITSGPPIPLPGSSPTAPIFAFAGYSLALSQK